MSPQALTPSALRAWLQLAHAPGLPPAVLHALLDAFGSPAALLRASDEAICAESSAAAARAVRASEQHDLDARTDAALAWLDAPGNAIVTLNDPVYPPRLRDLHDPPPLLYVKGRLDLLHARGLAVVGSRHATPQGLADATRSRMRCPMRGSRSSRASRSASTAPRIAAGSPAAPARSR